MIPCPRCCPGGRRDWPMVDADAGSCVCGGLGFVDVAADEDPQVEFVLARLRRVAGLYEACRRAMRLARRYQGETMPLRNSRIAGCLNAVNDYREQIATLRAMALPAGLLLEAAE